MNQASRTIGSASGKIILSGEYAVVFGYPGIAVPSSERTTVSFQSAKNASLMIEWSNPPTGNHWNKYVRSIIAQIEAVSKPIQGTIEIDNRILLQKGMGSSTSLVIALCRCLLGDDCRTQAHAIEDAVNPGHSGLDFSVIWEEKPILFQRTKDTKSEFSILNSQLSIPSWKLIDTGTPNETTPELVAWVRKRKNEPAIASALQTIGTCTERLTKGEALRSVMWDHHRAQVTLGVVTPAAQKIIAEIESRGGSAKVLGAGARTGGCGMILSIP
jgi:mevalonate kinase